MAKNMYGAYFLFLNQEGMKEKVGECVCVWVCVCVCVWEREEGKEKEWAMCI